MPARMGRLSAGVGRRHPITIRKASWMVGSMRRVSALRHQTGAKCSSVEYTRARVAVRRLVAPAPQPEPVSRLRSATRDVSFLRREVSETRERPVQRYAEVFGLGAERQGFVVEVDFKLTFSFLVVKVKGCRHRFCSSEL